MLAQPKLTICVPSRNRQRYFQETIRSLVCNLRTDVEFVFADNSDDPSIMNDFMTDLVGDPRIRYLPSEGRVLSMMDNWERSLEAATGAFITVIGDDDFVDINVIDLVRRLEAEYGIVDTLGWCRLTYNWPGNRPSHNSVSMPLATGVHRLPRARAYQDFFSWDGGRPTPNSVFTIYHSLVSKDVMDKIKAKFGGRYFNYPVVDYENLCKVLVTARSFFYSERTFSVLGSCAESNSGNMKLQKNNKESHARFMAEAGRNIDEDPHVKDFPFPSIVGLAACIAMTQNWFLTTYGYKWSKGWEVNLAKACASNCTIMATQESYDQMVASYRKILRTWRGGKYFKYFKPKPFAASTDAKIFTGIIGTDLLIDEEIAGIRTPADLYHIVDQMLARSADLKIVDHHALAA